MNAGLGARFAFFAGAFFAAAFFGAFFAAFFAPFLAAFFLAVAIDCLLVSDRNAFSRGEHESVAPQTSDPCSIRNRNKGDSPYENGTVLLDFPYEASSGKPPSAAVSRCRLRRQPSAISRQPTMSSRAKRGIVCAAPVV